MKILGVSFVLLPLVMLLGPWPAPAESPRRVEDPALRGESAAKERPARVVAVPSEASVPSKRGSVSSSASKRVKSSGRRRIPADRTAPASAAAFGGAARVSATRTRARCRVSGRSG